MLKIKEAYHLKLPRLISSNGANICPYIISDTYGLPMDPKLGDGSKITKCPATYNTGYLIKRDIQGNVTVSAPYAEMSESIAGSLNPLQLRMQ